MNNEEKESLDAKDESIKNNERDKNKYIFFGVIYGVIISVLAMFSLNIRFLINPLPNSKKIVNKLNEMNYIIDKFNMYEKDEEYIEDMISLGMMAGLKDRYANYYTKEDVEELNEEVSGEYVGIGVIVLEDVNDGYFTIVKMYEDSPAEEAGLQVLDKIKFVDKTDVSPMSSDEVVSLVKGPKDTKVNIGVSREGNEEILYYDITRRKIDTPMITAKFLDNNMLYISIESFEGKAYEQICDMKDIYEEQGINGVIIDVRNCPGGNLKVLLQTSDLFLDEGIITYFEDKDGNKEYYRSNDGKWDVPVAILTNEYTASAAEAFTAALKENGRARVFGTVTYGKGVVQEIFGLSDGTAIKFTVSKYFTPNGNEVNEKGITPDVEVTNTVEDEDTQFNAAYDYLLEMINKQD